MEGIQQANEVSDLFQLSSCAFLFKGLGLFYLTSGLTHAGEAEETPAH